MAHRNQHDADGESFQRGSDAEELFKSLILKKGWECENASLALERKHVDFIVADLNKSVKKIEVKARKKVNRSDSGVDDSIIYVEFKNVAGYAGWIYGESDIIAFEQTDHFLLVNRLALVDLCKKLVQFDQKVTRPTLYKVYTRYGRADVVSMIKVTDIITNLIPKTQYARLIIS
jgi:hypothetical protein